jgi:D-alanine-D-alanine ligase
MASSPTTVGLVFGGYSGEHEVSIRSAATVLGGLRSGDNRQRYRVIPFYIDREGRWWGEDLADRVLATQKPIDQPDPVETRGFRGLPEGSETGSGLVSGFAWTQRRRRNCSGLVSADASTLRWCRESLDQR